MPDECSLTVVTAVRNGIAGIRSCLESVAVQEPPVEHVVIDGDSQDGTVEVLRSWQRGRLVWVSRPDQGISDAFNDGIARATGSAILILGSDDILRPHAAARLVAALAAAPEAAFAFGHCLHRELDGRKWLNLADCHYWRRLRYYMPSVNHATMAIRRQAYDQVGGYALRYRYAMDYDWLLRAEGAGLRGVLVDGVLAEREMGGVSDRHWIRAYAEARDIAIEHHAPSGWAWASHMGRVAKGFVRRAMVGAGMGGTTHAIRRLNQRLKLGQRMDHLRRELSDSSMS